MMNHSLATKVLGFFRELSGIQLNLPEGVRVLDPYAGNYSVLETFLRKFYSDSNPRTLIIGINPGRFGAGTTGIMFTDTIRLNHECGIPFTKFRTYELSSEFFYKVINAYGGAEKFYSRFYVSAVSPLGFVSCGNGKTQNMNYYDHPLLLSAVKPFAAECLLKQMEFGLSTVKCICLGTGKNFHFLKGLNQQMKLFSSVIAVEHPRFIMQYRRKHLDSYIKKYLEILTD